MKKRLCAALLIFLLLCSVSALAAASWYSSIKSGANSLRLYDDNRVVVYVVAKYVYDPTMLNTDLAGFASKGDNIYSIYDADGREELVSFISSATKFRCLAKGDSTGTLKPLMLSGANKWVILGTNTEGISRDGLQKIMDFLGFSFDTDYPVLDKHFEARAGGWVVIEAGGKQETQKPVYRMHPAVAISKK